MIKLYIEVSDVIHANGHTKYANCTLHVNCWNFLLMSFCFMMKKDHFKQKLLLWPQVYFKINVLKLINRYLRLTKSSVILNFMKTCFKDTKEICREK